MTRPYATTPCRHYSYDTRTGSYAGEVGPLCAKGVDLTRRLAWSACMPLPTLKRCPLGQREERRPRS